MSKLPRIVAATAVLAIPLALVGCGSSASSGDTSSQQTGAPASSAAADGGGSGQQGAKPSKEDVVQGLIKFYAAQGKTGDPATKLANCIAGKSYTKLSPTTLQAMKDGKPKQIDPSDSAAFSKIAAKCAVAGAG